jgi:hypothetical protein
MDEEKKIMEKRSSFRGWKERNKERMHKKRKIIGIIIILSIFFAITIYPYLSKIDNDNKKNEKNVSLSIGKNKTSNPVKQNKTVSATSKISINNTNNTTNAKTNKTIINETRLIGKLKVPIIVKGFEITVKGVTVTEIRTSIWISIRNKDSYEKTFKIGPGTIMLDNIGQQYEKIRVTRSAEIVQTNLAAQALKEGAVFFERLKEGRKPKRLTLDINDEKVDFILD